MGPSPKDIGVSSGSSGGSEGIAPEVPQSTHSEVAMTDESATAATAGGPQQQPPLPAVLPQPDTPPLGASASSQAVSGAEQGDDAPKSPHLSSLAAEVAADELEEVVAEAARDSQALLHSVWTQLNYVMEPVKALREAADRAASSVSPLSATNTQHREFDQAYRDAKLADECTMEAALQKLRQAGALKTLEQQSDELRCSGGSENTALEHQIESAHLQLAGIQVDLQKAVEARWSHQRRLQSILASWGGYSHPPHAPHPPHLPHLPHPSHPPYPSVSGAQQAAAASTHSIGRHSCNTSSIGGTSIPSSIRSMAGETGLLGLLESPEPSNSSLRAAAGFAPRLLGGVVMRSTNAAGATFSAAPPAAISPSFSAAPAATISPTASSPFIASLNGLEPSDMDFSLGSVNSDDAGFSCSQSTSTSTSGSHVPAIPASDSS